MHIVIDIDEDTYKYMQSRCKYQNKGDKGLSKFEEAGVAIKNGTILPKGHERLIDADELKKEYPHDTDWDYPVNTNSYVVESIDNSHTIIEADKED